jgi:hypothetical protein
MCAPEGISKLRNSLVTKIWQDLLAAGFETWTRRSVEKLLDHKQTINASYKVLKIQSITEVSE